MQGEQRHLAPRGSNTQTWDSKVHWAVRDDRSREAMRTAYAKPGGRKECGEMKGRLGVRSRIIEGAWGFKRPGMENSRISRSRLAKPGSGTHCRHQWGVGHRGVV